MQDSAYWIFLGLIVFTVGLYFVWHKRDMRLLTIREKQKMSRAASRAVQREYRYIWIILGFFVGFMLLIKLLELPDGLYGVVMFGSLFYGIFRNIWIYRKIELPEKFVKSEFYLGTTVCVLMALVIYWAFWQK